MLLAGCFYVEPGWEPPVNQPPAITLPRSADQTQQLKIVTEATTLIVAAYDPDDEIVGFLWEVPHGVEHEIHEWQNPNGDYVSRLTVSRDEALDGEHIRCTVSDQAKPRNTVEVEWLVEVL